MEEDSTFVRHEPCPSCGSKDNLARYSDGHGYCFGCHYREHGSDSGVRNLEFFSEDLFLQTQVDTLGKNIRGVVYGRVQ